MKLTPKQLAYCEHFLETGNQTEAAIKAGYSKKTARVIGQENMLKPAIREYIEKRMAELNKKRIATADEVLEFLSRVVRGEEKDQFGFETSIADRTKAGELLLKRYKVFDRIDEKLEELKRKDMELNIKRKELEIEKMSGSENNQNKTLEAINKLKERVESDLDD